MNFSGNTTNTTSTMDTTMDIIQALPGLHIMLLILCALIFAGVVGVMFWSVFMHRRTKQRTTPHFHRKASVEVIWTIVPLVIVLLMALPATRTILSMRGASRAAPAVKAANAPSSCAPTVSRNDAPRKGSPCQSIPPCRTDAQQRK